MTTTTNPLTVANTIAAQIGRRAFFMMGATNLLGGEKALTFKIAGCREVSHVRVTLEPSDTYKVEFLKIRGATAARVHSVNTVHESDGIYADGLCQCIEANTGLALSL